MKPIRLTMQAFGPYKNKEVIDFTQLKDNRIFVISGNTGAGKTTIFDGIAFALYGHASGEDRKEHKSLRSDFANDDTHTAVELVFETRGKKYRVLRQLSHVKKGRKTATGENYEFMEVLPDGQEIHACEKQKAKEISQKIEEIIGLTYDQFNQIVMLPQGEFRKLLTSSTENKELILRKIFKTERYSKIAERLEAKKKLAEKQRDEAKTMRDMYVDQITGALPERESELFERLKEEVNIYQIMESLQAEKAFYEKKQIEDEKVYSELQQVLAMKQQELSIIQQQNERLQQLQQKQQQLHEKEQQKPRYESMKQEAEQGSIALQIASIFEAVELVTREQQQQNSTLAELQQQLQQGKEALQVAQENLLLQQQTEEERKQLEQTIHDLKKVEPLFATVAMLQSEVANVLSKLGTLQMALENNSQQLREKMGLIEQLNATEEQLEREVRTLPEKLLEQQLLKQQLQLIKQFENAVKKVEVDTTTADENQKLLLSVQQQYKELEQSWLNNQALELASHLVEGEPCPVCGSKVHELHHTLQQEQVISKEMLSAKKRQVDEASHTFYEGAAMLTSSKEQLEQLRSQLLEQQITIENKAAFEEKYKELTLYIQQLQQKQATLNSKRQERKQAVALQQQLQQKQQELQGEKQQYELLIETKKVEIASLQQQIPQQYADYEALKLAIIEKQKRYEQLVQQYNNAQQVFDKARLATTKLEEAVYQTEQQLHKLQIKQQQSEAQWQNSLQQSPFENEQQFKEAIRTRQQIEQLQQHYTTFMQQLFALQQFVVQEQEHLQDVELVDVSQMIEELEKVKRLSEQAYITFAQTKHCIKVCAQYEENLKSVAQKIIELEDVANNILNLYNVLRGQNSKKISFERYVQIGFLEQITAAANVRLNTLSNGQYRLVSSERQLSHGRQSGLSLDVHDSYTGQVRDVKTLSGGEKFNASLCLALGMADVIQSFEGNVRIDTMFIDEGFGSLDEESLTRAIDTLIDLQKSGRIIGVISHVAELKAAIPAVLEVVKLKEGYSKTSITVKI